MDSDLDAAHLYLSFALLLTMGTWWAEMFGLIVTAYHYWKLTRTPQAVPRIESMP